MREPSTQAGPDDPVRRIMTTPVATVSADATVVSAAGELVGNEIGAVIVVSPRGPIGVLSERDVVRLVAEGGDPADTDVVDAMVGDVLWAEPHESIRDVANRMRDAGVRHLPVRDQNVVLGMVSIRDVLAVLLGGR